jgi:prepilin-type N-terminal cleavage/methylation domain-containing protein
MEKPYKKNLSNGFTLAELLVAMVITGIILSSALAMAFAMDTAKKTSDDTSQKQAQARYAILRISELLRECKLITATHANDFAIWRADDNGDGRMNIGEIAYIDKGENGNCLRISTISGAGIFGLSLSDTKAISTLWWSTMNGTIKTTTIIPQCSNVQFEFDGNPPQTKFVTVSFNLDENGTIHQYQISTSIRCWAGNTLNGSGNIVTTEDD